MEHLLQRTVSTIRQRSHEPLSLDDLAASAVMSKFYFLRLFTRVTGVTPGRFLSAVRLHHAKRLLLTTSLNVAGIAVHVGYSSAGTFSRRFSESVGLSPTRYRQLDHAKDPGRLLRPLVPADPCFGSVVHGTLVIEGRPTSTVHLGLFPTPILQGIPIAHTTLTASGAFSLPGIPPGTWYVHAVAQGAHPVVDPYIGIPLLVAASGPVHVTAERNLRVDLTMRPSDWTRPPVLLALDGLDPVPRSIDTDKELLTRQWGPVLS